MVALVVMVCFAHVSRRLQITVSRRLQMNLSRRLPHYLLSLVRLSLTISRLLHLTMLPLHDRWRIRAEWANGNHRLRVRGACGDASDLHPHWLPDHLLIIRSGLGTPSVTCHVSASRDTPKPRII